MKSCPLDPAPTSVVPMVIDVLLPVITSMINMSFESRSVRRGMEAGPRITHVKEMWSRHRVQKLSPSKQSPVCLQVI